VEVPEWVVVVVVAWGAVGNPLYIPLEHNMKTFSKITILLISATLAGSVFARGPGGGGGGGVGGGGGMSSGSGSQNQHKYQYGKQGGQGAGQSTQTRAQTRDPAGNPTGQPIQQRVRIHSPGTGLSVPTTN